jgi:hypothetical protein
MRTCVSDDDLTRVRIDNEIGIVGERRDVAGFRFIFSPSEAVNDVHDDGILHVVKLLSVVVYDVDQPAWAR